MLRKALRLIRPLTTGLSLSQKERFKQSLIRLSGRKIKGYSSKKMASSLTNMTLALKKRKRLRMAGPLISLKASPNRMTTLCLQRIGKPQTKIGSQVLKIRTCSVRILLQKEIRRRFTWRTKKQSRDHRRQGPPLTPKRIYCNQKYRSHSLH